MHVFLIGLSLHRPQDDAAGQEGAGRIVQCSSVLGLVGAIGGLLSGVLYALTEPHSPLASWLYGIGGNGLFMAAMLGI